VKTLLFVAVTCLLWTSSAAAALQLRVDLSARQLSAVVDGKVVENFAVAIGNREYPTPKGQFKIRKVIWNPAWRPHDSKWARGKEAKPAGDPDNPMKRVKIFFKEPDYYIHGTDDEDSLGRAESHGCLRMHVADATRLAQLVMEQGGKPMPEPWYRRVFRRKTTKVVYLAVPIPVEIRG
jgi:lipoprotein-anchoring transpeptidase ErfK/SrfK